jgi:hypothetical protein
MLEAGLSFEHRRVLDLEASGCQLKVRVLMFGFKVLKQRVDRVQEVRSYPSDGGKARRGIR